MLSLNCVSQWHYYSDRKFSKNSFGPERFFMKMAFHRRSCSIVVTIKAGLTQFLKIGSMTLFADR